MGKQLAISVIVCAFLFDFCVCTCLDAETSEGYAVLQDGQRACAPLRINETIADKGKRFVTCSHGNVFVQLCPAELRFDTRSSICNWPEFATCETVVPPPDVPPTLPVPTPRVVRAPPIGPCSDANCQLPDCLCYGYTPNIHYFGNQPMFIMLSFDGHVSSYYFDTYYRSLVLNPNHTLFNPGGCKSKFAFYVSHETTDYTKVRQLWEAGHEIGSYTVHGRLPAGLNQTDYAEVAAEINGIKEEIFRATGNRILVDSVNGFRAPNLHMAYNVQFDALSNYNFKYDSSILNTLSIGRLPPWPFTLDFLVPECGNPPCPANQYPGLWEVPVSSWIGDDHVPCNTIDACTVGTSSWMASEQQWYYFFKRHFDTHFYPTKAPMPISIPSAMFDRYTFFPALTRWLRETLQTRPDVWLVTPQQVISWLASPQGNEEMKAQRWGC